jgi:glycosyltransferase involved in cell wall biosynthesis
MNKLPFMSVVVIGWNSADFIGRALDSLLAQDYPKDRYEVIMADDGSTDNTKDAVAQYPSVIYVGLPKNMGQASARNAGFEIAKGDVYVAFDSDCVAKPDWLSELAKGYELPDVIGVGGVITPMEGLEIKGLATHYIEATGSGMTGGVDESRLKSLPSFLRRFVVYFGNKFATRSKAAKQDTYKKVDELYGANASFPMEVLRTVGGWDPNATAPVIGGIEDRDLCVRIHRAYPGKQFYAMRHAHMMHDPTISLKNYLLRSYRRGPFNYHFHIENGMTPPIFPWPPIMFVALIVTALLMPLALPLVLLLLPQVLYFWWVQRAIVERQRLYLLFPYLQLAEETMVLTGLIKGFIVHNKRSNETP